MVVCAKNSYLVQEALVCRIITELLSVNLIALIANFFKRFTEPLNYLFSHMRIFNKNTKWNR